MLMGLGWLLTYLAYDIILQFYLTETSKGVSKCMPMGREEHDAIKDP